MVNLSRFILAFVFIFSGFVKAIDLWGFEYKITDYLIAFDLGELLPLWTKLLFSFFLSAIEFAIGGMLLLGIRVRGASLLALLLMLLMTPLTLYIALYNPVSDCGCFGDALVITNWETFYKNLVLLAAAIILVLRRKYVVSFIRTYKIQAYSFMYLLLFISAVAFYSFNNLPLFDFRPYKIGTNIYEGMQIPDDAKPSKYATTFIMEKDGKQQTFSLENYPDSTWRFVDSKSVLVEQGYVPPIHDFSMIKVSDDRDITDSVLTDKGYNFLLVSHRIERASQMNVYFINELYDYALANGYGFYALTSSPVAAIEKWQNETGANYPFCHMDDITLKTMIRSNPGLMLVKDGVIIDKWSNTNLTYENLPLNKKLDELYSDDTVNEDQALIVYVILMLLFALPLVGLIGFDVYAYRLKKRRLQQ